MPDYGDLGLSDIGDIIKSGVTGGKFDWGQVIKLILAGVTGYNIDINNMAQGIDPKKAVGIVSDRYNAISSLKDRYAGGYTPSADLQQARTGSQQSLNRPVTPPAVFNPYATNPTQGQLDPALMQRLMGFAMGNNAPASRASNTNMLQQSLNNRFTPRPMGGGTPPVNNPITPSPNDSPIGSNIVNRDYPVGNTQGLPPEVMQRLMKMMGG